MDSHIVDARKDKLTAIQVFFGIMLPILVGIWWGINCYEDSGVLWQGVVAFLMASFSVSYPLAFFISELDPSKG